MQGQRWSVFVLLTACCTRAASGQCLFDLHVDGIPVDGVVAPYTEVSGAKNDQVNYCVQVQAGVTYDFVVTLGGSSCQDCLLDSCVALVRAIEPLLTVPIFLWLHSHISRTSRGASLCGLVRRYMITNSL
jgi:hypothetical protein